MVSKIYIHKWKKITNIFLFFDFTILALHCHSLKRALGFWKRDKGVHISFIDLDPKIILFLLPNWYYCTADSAAGGLSSIQFTGTGRCGKLGLVGSLGRAGLGLRGEDRPVELFCNKINLHQWKICTKCTIFTCCCYATAAPYLTCDQNDFWSNRPHKTIVNKLFLQKDDKGDGRGQKLTFLKLYCSIGEEVSVNTVIILTNWVVILADLHSKAMEDARIARHMWSSKGFLAWPFCDLTSCLICKGF